MPSEDEASSIDAFSGTEASTSSTQQPATIAPKGKGKWGKGAKGKGGKGKGK